MGAPGAAGFIAGIGLFVTAALGTLRKNRGGYGNGGGREPWEPPVPWNPEPDWKIQKTVAVVEDPFSDRHLEEVIDSWSSMPRAKEVEVKDE
jgi:hypothetical protein